jgi:PAS domain S-box-containing protein
MAEKTIVSNVSEGFEVKKIDDDFTDDLFKTVCDLTTDGLAITENGHFLHVNDQLLAIFKLKREQIIGKNSIDLIHKDDVAKAMEEVAQNRKILYELRVRRGDGIFISTEVRGHPVMYHGKKCRLLIVKDITQRKISDKLFNNYLNIIDAFPEAICVHDKSGKILFVNRSGLKLVSATSQDQVIGRNVMEFVLPEHQATIRENKPRFEKQEAITGRFVKMRQLFGTGEPISVEASVIPTEWGEEPAAMVLCHDTSLEEQIEKSEIAKQVMQSVNEHLQWEITEHKVLQMRLKKMVEEKEWLLKEVNHRVKNNLQIITSILNLQINQMPDPKLVPVMREFQNRFYALSSIYSSLYHSEADEEIDISSYLKDLTHNLFVSYSDPQKRITIDCETSRIFLDYDHAITCGLIVNELVSNSIKYAFPNEKTGKIKVTLKQTGKKVTLEVSDNGVGIKQKTSKKQRVSLGLQLVDSLVTQLKDGEVKKTSDAKGTKYSIIFKSNNQAIKKSSK